MKNNFDLASNCTWWTNRLHQLPIPTLDEYIALQISNARQKAVERMLFLKYPYVPILNYKKNNTGVLEPVYGASCIYTSTGVYGKPYQVAGNLTFCYNPMHYGFKRIHIRDLQIGDLFQVWKNNTPTHMMMFAGYDANGVPRFHYSNGNNNPNDASAMRRNAKYYSFQAIDDYNKYNDTHYKSWTDLLEHSGRGYTFVGVEKDKERWTNEYYNLYGQQEHPYFTTE